MDADARSEDQGKGETIAGDRRADRRYTLQLDLRWKLIRRRRVLDQGTGSTVDLSSGGILFDAGRPLPPGLNVELSISWPILLHNVAPLQLLVFGRIIRSSGPRAAIRMVQHEFKTTGTATVDHRALLGKSGPNPTALFAIGGAFGKPH